MKTKQLLTKMLLLLAVMLMGAGSAWADDVTFAYGDYKGKGTSSSGSEYTMVKDDVSIKNDKFYGNNSYAHFYANGTTTITPEDGVTITKIDLTASATGYNGYQSSGTITPSIGEVSKSSDGLTITWSGSATEAFTISNNKQIRWTSIVVTYTKSGGDTPATYIVTYDGNGATSGDVPTDDTKYDANNNTVTVLGNTGNLAKEHYTYTGWNTAKAGTGTGYVKGNTFTISANTTLYAQWAINTNTVTLPDADQYGTYAMSATNPVAYGTEVTLTYTPAEGYEKYVATWSVNDVEISDNKFTMPDEAVTITVSLKKVLAMAIDFESEATTYSDWTFTNIVSNYKNSGVDTHGGSKYGSTDGKESGSIQTKNKISPASFTCYVSKQSNNTTSSTWYVQVSSDGNTWTNAGNRSATDMSKGEWKEFSVDLSTYSDVYVRVSYNGSTAVRLIDDLTLVLQDPDKPSITITGDTDINVGANGIDDGSIAFTLLNVDADLIELQFVASDGKTAATYDWLTADFNTDKDAIEYIVDPNFGEERTAYMIIYGVDEETKDVYSDLITITQAAFETPKVKYALFSGDLVEGDYVIYYKGDEGRALTNVVSDANRLKYTVVTPTDEDVIATNNAAIVWHIAPSGNYWTIYSANANAYAAGTGVANKAQMLADGTDDKALWSVSVTDEGYEFVNKANAAANVNSNLRNNGTFGFACYSSATGGALSLYKMVTESVSITDAGYATYCSTNAIDFTNVEGLTAYKATVSDKQVTFTEVNQVPAGEGVLLKGTEGTYTIPVLTHARTIENDFEGVTEDTEKEAGIFVLMNPEGGKGVGFYQTKNAFTVGANTAYLPATAGARSFIAIDEATGIDGIVAKTMGNGEIFNLQGQRVTKAQKGLYIMDGKKVVMK